VGVFAYLWVDASFLKRPEAGIFHYLKKAHNHGSPSKTSSIMGISVLIGILHEFPGPCRNLALGYHVWMAFHFPFTVISWNCYKRLKCVYLFTFRTMPLSLMSQRFSSSKARTSISYMFQGF
jgi:hypothetical protein